MKPELLYEYIMLRHNEHTVHSMCQVLHVSESGYYRSVRRIAGTKLCQLLLVKIREIYAETPDNRNYGVRRIQLALEQQGIRVSRSGVRRAMKRGGLLKSTPHRANSLTKADATAQKAGNLIRRDFSAQTPNQKWLTDITQVSCADGKLYIAAVLDCYNGEIVGLAMDSNMKKGTLHPRVSFRLPGAECIRYDSAQRSWQSVHLYCFSQNLVQVWRSSKYERHRALL